jgi:hypothetical protein
MPYEMTLFRLIGDRWFGSSNFTEVDMIGAPVEAESSNPKPL